MTETATNAIVDTSSAIWQAANTTKSSIIGDMWVSAALQEPKSSSHVSLRVVILNTHG